MVAIRKTQNNKQNILVAPLIHISVYLRSADTLGKLRILRSNGGTQSLISEPFKNLLRARQVKSSESNLSNYYLDIYT